MKPEIYYTALNTYDSEEGLSWKNYTEGSKLTHLKELVSLDGILNRLSFDPDFDSKTDWNYIVTDGEMMTLFFNSMYYVLEKVKDLKYYNLLAVIKEPQREKAALESEFEFVGYDLIEKDGDISALTNCGGFDETFLSKDLNQYGLVTAFEKAKRIQNELPINNPAEHHADCYLYEVWRHKIIGRKNKV